MKDICTESIVPIIPTTMDKILKILLLAVTVILGLLGLFGNFLFLLAAVVTGFLFYRTLGRTNAEYEYIHTNDVFDVDRVVNSARRQQLTSINLNHVILVAPEDSPELDRYQHLKETDFSGGHEDARYAMIVTREGKHAKLILRMTPEMHRSLKLWLPGKVL